MVYSLPKDAVSRVRDISEKRGKRTDKKKKNVERDLQMIRDARPRILEITSRDELHTRNNI